VVESAHVVPEAIAARIAALAAPPALRVALTRYAAELVAWQSARSARAWLDVLERVARAERAVDPASTRLLAAVAANLFKLTAYKDEYEVARLMTDADGLAAAREVAGRRGKIAWRLHPPLLRAMGLSHKIAIGAWAAPLVRLLAKGKVLRGTALDPFGYTHVRRLERELSGEYVAAVDHVVAALYAREARRRRASRRAARPRARLRGDQGRAGSRLSAAAARGARRLRLGRQMTGIPNERSD
jgi:indolepyruvate ferredoxin oxidoreductase